MGGIRLDTKQLKQDIIDYAYTIGIDSIGFTTADPFNESKQKLKHIMQMVMPQDLKNLILLYERSLNYPYQQQGQS